MDLASLATLAGNALVNAAVTDAWEDVRRKIARLFGRGELDGQIETRLDATRAALEIAQGAEAGGARDREIAGWTARMLVLLEDFPEASGELNVIVNEIQARLQIASDQSVAAGRDINARADRGGVAAGSVHGSVSTGPTWPGQVIS